MDGEPGAGVQLLMTDVALEVFGFLMLDENLFIIEISVTVPEITAEETLDDKLAALPGENIV